MVELWILTLIDEYTRECLALKVARKLNSQDVLEQLVIFLYIEDCQDSSDRIMVLSLQQKPSETGWNN